MNKTISYISSLVVVLGLGTLYALDKVDGVTFGTVSATILALIWALYQKFENGVLTNKLVDTESKLLESEFRKKKAQDDFLHVSNAMNDMMQKVQVENENKKTEPLEVIKNREVAGPITFNTKKEDKRIVAEVDKSISIEDVLPKSENPKPRKRNKK